MEKPSVLGIDIGGSHITAAFVNLETRSILPDSRRRRNVDSQGDVGHILDSWSAVINESFKSGDYSPQRIGIAMPGPFDYKNGISLIQDQDKFNAFYKINIKEKLAKRLNMPTDDILFINDAVSFLRGEVFGGAARNYNRVLGITLGTGLGSAIYDNGVAEDADLWSSPFKNGIAEDYLSGRWFLKRYNELTGKTISGVKELLELGDAEVYVAKIFLEFARNLSLFLVPLIRKHDAEAVVIGGNISNAFNLFLPELIRLLEEDKVKAVIKIASLKEDASLVGAASCWENIYAK